MDDLNPNLKVKIGSTEELRVLMPEYWSGSPTLTFRRGGDDIASAGFAAKRAPDSCTAISGTVLTGVFAAGVGLQGPVGGLAFLVTAQDGIFTVQINKLTTTTAVLAEPLERDATITALLPASLVWRWWSAAIPAAVSASETGTTPADWRVEYTANDGTALGTRANQRFGGLIHVTAERFSTGIGTEALIHHYGRHIPRPAASAQGYAGEIEAARMELQSYVRYRLAESASGRREDDLIATDEPARMAHLCFAVANVVASTKPEFADAERKRAKEFADQWLATASWYDPSGTGEGAHGTPAAQPTVLVSSNLPARADRPLNRFSYNLGPGRG